MNRIAVKEKELSQIQKKAFISNKVQIRYFWRQWFVCYFRKLFDL